MIIIGDQGEAVKLYFKKETDLDGVHYGTWDTDKNFIELSTEAWQFFRHYSNDIGKLRPLIDRLHKFESIKKLVR